MQKVKKLFDKILIFITLELSILVPFASCEQRNTKQEVPQKTEVVETDTLLSLPCREEERSYFCLLTDSVPRALIEMRYYGTNNFMGCQVDGYEEPIALITHEAAHALRLAEQDLNRKGYLLKIYDAYRPQCAVDHFFRWAKEPSDTIMKSEYYPTISKEQIFRRGFVARKSSHSRGSTVDLTLVDQDTGEEVDMGGSFDLFDSSSHTDYEEISAEQRANRQLLKETMMRYGFKPARGEWWHFTLVNEPFPDKYFQFKVRR